MKIVLIALALFLGATQAHANSAKFCVAWSDTSTEMFSMRKRGLNREDVKELASDGKEWSVASDYALKHAFESSEKMDLEAYRMKKFRQCREDDV